MVRQQCCQLYVLRRATRTMQATVSIPSYKMQRSGAIPINPTQLSNSIAFYTNSNLRHPHSHSSTSHQANMTSSGQITANPVTVSSPTKRNNRRVKEGGIRKAQSPRKRKNGNMAARFHPLNIPRVGDASSSACPDDASPVVDDWDPIEMMKNTFGEDCTYLDFPPEEENPQVELPWSKEAAEMVAHANFVYDVCCEPYKHFYGM